MIASELLDSDDPRYIKSFQITELESAKAFFDEYGFVVWREIYSSEECQASRDAMWQILEETNPGLDRNTPASWSNFRASGNYCFKVLPAAYSTN